MVIINPAGKPELNPQPQYTEGDVIIIGFGVGLAVLMLASVYLS